MALLNENINHDVIQLLGRWRSDTVLRYLHLQAHDVMQDFSKIMLQGGNYNLIPVQHEENLPLSYLPPSHATSPGL